MYVLLAKSTDVEVTIEQEGGSLYTIMLDPDQTYAEQSYGGLFYSQNTYDSDEGETSDTYSVDNNYPEDGDIIYDYCNDIAEPTEEP